MTTGGETGVERASNVVATGPLSWVRRRGVPGKQVAEDMEASGHDRNSVMEELARLVTLGNQLVDIHLRLREQLAGLRAGNHKSARELAEHCVGFCAALTRHHSGEDGGAFMLIGAEFPQLQPVLDELRRDHQLIAEAVRTMSDSPTSLQLDTLAALMETHFTYEERKLVAALNRLDPGLGAGILGA
jgi:hypothetical protein